MRHDLKLVEVCRMLVNPRVGLFRKIVDIPKAKGTGDIYLSVVETADPHYFRSFDHQGGSGSIAAAGAGLTRNEALWSALGEATERFTASVGAVDELIAGRYSDLKDRAVDPDDFIAYTPEQYSEDNFPFEPHAADVARRWTWSTDLLSNEHMLVPAQLVWLGFECPNRSERLRESVSSGLACGPSPLQCAHSALREVIERDAFMATWLLRRPPPKFLVNDDLLTGLDPGLEPLLRHPHLTTDLRLITTDLSTPAVLALVGPRRGGQRVVGAAAHPDLAMAIRKATMEAHHTWAWSVHLRAKTEAKPADKIDSFADHVRFYLEPANQHYLAFLDDGLVVDAKWSRPADAGIELRHMLEDLARLGYRAFFCDLTTADIASVGLYVGRILVPGLHPLSCGPRLSCLDDRRLRQIADHWKIPPGYTFNLHPHPFP
jgi:ribosomal protein S12 methylthiotransferase accessory factor